MSSNLAVHAQSDSTAPSQALGNRPVKSTRLSRSSVRLILAFLATTIVACGVVLIVGRLAMGVSGGWREVEGEEGKDSLFPEALLVNAPGLAIRVPHATPLDPAAEKDFLFFSWFMIRRPLTADDRPVFIGKYDPNDKIRPGYSIGLEGGVDGVRPTVYWQDEGGKGRWFPFASAHIRPKEWYLLAVTFRNRRYLGVHLASAGTPSAVQVLGGYDLEEAVVPASPADLIVGAFGPSKFRGRIGAFGVIRKRNLTDGLDDLVREMAEDPTKMPSRLDAVNIALWASPIKDQSQSKLAITLPPRYRGERAADDE